MNWDNIRVFVAIVRAGSIKQAASVLGINHSTVIRRMASLENELNAQLFNRRQSGYELTPVGEDILQLALVMEQDVNMLKRQVAAKKDEVDGELTLSCRPNAFFDLTGAIMEFQQSYPKIKINMSASTNLTNLDRLEADIGIRMTNTPPDDCVGTCIFNTIQAVYASPHYLDSIGSISKLSDVDWISYSNSQKEAYMDDWLRSQDTNVRIKIWTNSLDALGKLLQEGAGVCFYPKHLAGDKGLVKFPLLPEEHEFQLWVLTHGDLRFQPKVQKFMRFIVDYLQKEYPDYITNG